MVIADASDDPERRTLQLPSSYAGPSLLSDLDKAMQLEWVVSNGLRGYASSTVLGINTRKH